MAVYGAMLDRQPLRFLLAESWLDEAWEDRARVHAIADLVPRHLAEVKDRRLSEIGKIEAAAMNAVMERERALGHEPCDVSVEDRGYDIESREAGTARLRFIEVKGRRADARAVTVTRNEMLAAYNARDAYILAVAPIKRGIAQGPVYLSGLTRVFGSEPGFAEVSRTILVEAIRQAAGYLAREGEP